MPQLNGQIVRFIKPDDDGDFYLVACFKYDQSLDIVHTGCKRNPIMFDINVEPGILRVHDFIINFEENNTRAILSTISTIDGGLSLDTAIFKCWNGNKLNIIEDSITTYSEKLPAIQAFCAKWPYVTFSGLKKDFIMILNAFDSENIHRVQIHGKPNKICQTYITDTNDLFIMV